ncbi:hypothetical protein I552_10137 [Mycobacterium xenopi 3993]|nr:hypothetical protein I552_10137 [Mycobacterium xenopi 3993]
MRDKLADDRYVRGVLSFASCRFDAIALPHPMDPPPSCETDTGTNSPMTPATRSTAPTNRINRRTVTLAPLPTMLK